MGRGALRFPHDKQYPVVAEKRSAAENDIYLPYWGGSAAPSGDWKRRVGGSQNANRNPHYANGRMLFSASDGTVSHEPDFA